MKKALTLVLALVLCLSALSVAAFAANYNYVVVTGTMNGWDPTNKDFQLTESSTNVYTLTKNMAAGTYEFKFTANGNWNDLNLGGAFMGSGQEANLYWSGSNISITLEEASDVTFKLDLTNFDGANGAKCTITIGDKVDEAVGNIKVHISVPEGWGDVYAYTWNPEHLGIWAGTKVENGVVEVTAKFEGMVISNGNGTQTADIKDIDFSKEEVWITVTTAGADGKYGYTLSYTKPSGEDVTPTGDITVHIIAPESWASVYAYTFNPQQLGDWPGTKVESGSVKLPKAFAGFIVHNNDGVQTADITDIDLTKDEVWIVVNEYGAYTLHYTEPDLNDEPDAGPIKINVIAKNWTSVYAYTYNPELDGTWPGTLVENGSFETLNVFAGLVLSNGEGQQTWDITDIDLTKEEVWVVVGEADEYGKFSYTLYYSAPTADQLPKTGDNTIVFAVLLMAVSACAVTFLGKKKYF